MVWLIKSLINAVKVILIGGVIAASPIISAKPHRTISINQDTVLATSYSVQDIESGEILKSLNDQEIRSIASITKLMTAIVIINSGIDLSNQVKVSHIKGISTKIPNNSYLSLFDLLHLSLMSSDNLAAKTIALNYPGGEEQHVIAMNNTAISLGMINSRYTDPTGLQETNVSTVQDLVKLIKYAESFSLIKEFSTSPNYEISLSANGKPRNLVFSTTNKLLKTDNNIVLSKTGWLNKSGGCLVMLVREQGRLLAVVLLNSKNTVTRIRDGVLLYTIK